MKDAELEVAHRAFAIAPEIAAKYGVLPDVHPEDFIFRFIITHPRRPILEHAVDYYFGDGERSARRLRLVLQEVCGWRGESIELLEFASGYGCVSRHLRKVLPEIDVTSSDIHPAAMDFITGKLGLPTVLSSSVPEQLNTPPNYDVVFALSFFSHLPKKSWGRWLRVLSSKLKPGGSLIFTTHGLVSRDRFGNPELDSDGFWFDARSEQKDLDTSEYGVACTAPLFVFREASADCDGRIIHLREGYWWEHQDLYVLKRNPVREGDSQELQQLAGSSGLLNTVEALSIQLDELRRRARDLEEWLHRIHAHPLYKLYRLGKRMIGRRGDSRD